MSLDRNTIIIDSMSESEVTQPLGSPDLPITPRMAKPAKRPRSDDEDDEDDLPARKRGAAAGKKTAAKPTAKKQGPYNGRKRGADNSDDSSKSDTSSTPSRVTPRRETTPKGPEGSSDDRESEDSIDSDDRPLRRSRGKGAVKPAATKPKLTGKVQGKKPAPSKKSAPAKKSVTAKKPTSSRKPASARKSKDDDDSDDDSNDESSEESDGEPNVAKTKFEMAALKSTKDAAKLMAGKKAQVQGKWPPTTKAMLKDMLAPVFNELWSAEDEASLSAEWRQDAMRGELHGLSNSAIGELMVVLEDHSSVLQVPTYPNHQ